MTKIFAATLFMIIQTAFADSEGCRVSTSSTIFKINKVLDSSFIKTTDCSGDVVQELVSLISSARGKLKPTHLGSMFKTDFGRNVEFENEMEIVDLKERIREKLGMDGLAITALTSLYGNASINTDNPGALNFECPSCATPGEKNIKITNEGKVVWLSSTIKARRKGYRLTSDVSPFSHELTPQNLEPSYALDNGLEPFFTDLENLRFYRPVKPLLKGHALKQNDLALKTLVNFNQSVDVILTSEAVSLKTKGTARQNGKRGETIKVHNPKTNKEIYGKVIDFNTVLVEL